MQSAKNIDQKVSPSTYSRQLPVVETVELFRGSQEILIRHADQEYRLRITSLNKLILTK